MSRRVVPDDWWDDVRVTPERPLRAERALALAVVHQALTDLTTRPCIAGKRLDQQRFVRQRHGAALFLTGDPTRKTDEASYADLRAFWCGLADVTPEALEARVWAQHGALLRYVLDHPPETPSSKWRALLRRRRAGRLRRMQAAA